MYGTTEPNMINHFPQLHRFFTGNFPILAVPEFFPFTVAATRMANIVELSVGLHCEECIKKILKAIKKLDDIETYNVDTKLNKVIVTGDVKPEQVIKALHKIGKSATIWGQQVAN